MNGPPLDNMTKYSDWEDEKIYPEKLMEINSGNLRGSLVFLLTIRKNGQEWNAGEQAKACKPYWVVEWQDDNGECYWLVDAKGQTYSASVEEITTNARRAMAHRRLHEFGVNAD